MEGHSQSDGFVHLNACVARSGRNLIGGMLKSDSPMSKKRMHAYDEDIGLPVNIFKRENVAIVLAYFSVGLVGSFLSTPLNIYLVEYLNAEPQMQNTIGILQTLPWSLKLAFGFLSDAVPLFGMHRKPYLAIGAVLYSTAYMAYAMLGVHSVVLLSACVFLATVGLIQMDVMADTMCVQRSKYESEESRGQMQASCYSIRFAGSLIGAICGASLCNKQSWGWGLDFRQLAFLNGLIPFILVTPSLFTLRERFHFSPEVMATLSKKEAPVAEADVEASSASALDDGAVNETTGLLELPVKPKNYSSVDDHASAPHGKKVVLHEDARLVPDMHSNAAGFHTFGHAEVLESDGTPCAAQPQLGSGPTSAFPPKHAHSSASGDAASAQAPSSLAYDEQEDEPKSITQQLDEIWQTVQLQSVWRPMAFVYTFNLFQVPNVSWQSFLQLNLSFPPWILGMTVILGSFMTFAGVMAYKYFFFKTSWRKIYVWTVCLTAFFSLMQLCLIFQWNTKYLHLNNYFFSLGDDVISAYISGIQFLPLCIMYMRLCPEGAEGASYAMLTTFGNIALVCASNVGNLLANVWDVSNDAMRHHDVSGLWKLNTLTSVLSVLPLSLLFLLPRDAEEQERLAQSQKRSRTAGIIFLSVLFGSLLWTICTALSRLME